MYSTCNLYRIRFFGLLYSMIAHFWCFAYFAGDGRLTLAELGAALRRAGARLSLSQVTALFRHFDEGLGLDTVGRG